MIIMLAIIMIMTGTVADGGGIAHIIIEMM